MTILIAKANNPGVPVIYRIQKFPTCRSHRSQGTSQLSVRIEFSKLGGQKTP